MKKTVSTLSVIALLTSCASITGPGNQVVKIETTPSEADVVVDGMEYTSPAVVTLKGSSGYTVVAKKKGYKDGYSKIKGEPRILASVVGNIFNLTGVIGMAVDFFGTGAAYKLDNEVKIDLRKETN